MTAATCLEFCASESDGKSAQYAGLEKGKISTTPNSQFSSNSASGRECWCAPSLSVLSEKLIDQARCTLACSGNSSEICGGQLALSLYNLTSLNSKTGIAWSQFSGAAGYGTLAVITLIIAAVL